MCLALPGRIVSLDGDTAVIDLHGNRLEVCTVLTPDARVEDWVLIHAGFSISRIEEQAARETWTYLDEAWNAACAETPLASRERGRVEGPIRREVTDG